MTAAGRPRVIRTVGHSTRPIEEFVALLRAHGIDRVADARRCPASRRRPRFDREPLAAARRDAGIGHRHLRGLGGRRAPRPGSPSTGWREAGFRGRADHMAAGACRDALRGLEEAAGRQTVAIVCAEALPWRCRRALIADALSARRRTVLHVTSPAPRRRIA